MSTLPKIIVLLGPTASGKTKLGIALAKGFDGEVVSADSRQLYKKMPIGTAQPPGVWQRRGRERVFMVDGVPHYMMGISDPGKEVTLADYKERAIRHIDDILKRGKLPIIVGGTGLYIWAIVDNLAIPKVAPNKGLRKSLETKSLEELTELLRTIDPETYQRIDMKNPRRVLRALEVAILSGESFTEQQKKLPPLYEALQIGLAWDSEVLARRIDQRIEEQMRDGFLEEIKALVKQKYGWHLPSMSSIGYKQLRWYLDGECTLDEATQSIQSDTKHYAKKQMTWFKRDKRIKWIEQNNERMATELVEEFLPNKKQP